MPDEFGSNLSGNQLLPAPSTFALDYDFETVPYSFEVPADGRVSFDDGYGDICKPIMTMDHFSEYRDSEVDNSNTGHLVVGDGLPLSRMEGSLWGENPFFENQIDGRTTMTSFR